MDTAPDGVPATFTSVQLRWLLGLSNSRLEQFTTAGIIIRIEKGSYTANSIRRHVEFLRKAQDGSRDWQAVRTALAKEKLAMARLDRAEREGQVARTEDFVSNVRALFLLVRNRALALPRLRGASTPALTHEILDVEVREWLTELSETRVINSLTGRNDCVNPRVAKIRMSKSKPDWIERAAKFMIASAVEVDESRSSPARPCLKQSGSGLTAGATKCHLLSRDEVLGHVRDHSLGSLRP